MKRTKYKKTLFRLYAFTTLFALNTSCIENDIPYPIREGSITAIEVEGQCDVEGNNGGQAVINKNDRTVTLYVGDTVDCSKLRITRFSVSNESVLLPTDNTQCVDYQRFPTNGFNSLEEIPLSSDTRMDFTRPASFILRTYQDYRWTISVEQIVKREIILENQVGKAVIDDENHCVVIYVAPNQPLDKIKVSTFNLGGQHGTVIPDPTTQETFDFSQPVSFFVAYAWEEASYPWKVFVYQKEYDANSIVPEVFPMTTRAYLSGNITQGKQPVIEYKKETASDWLTLSASEINISGTTYTATLTKLAPNTSYQCRTTVGDFVGTAQTFTTASATPLPDGDFDTWHLKDGKLWNPWDDNGNKYWDTGNRGATTIGDSNVVPDDNSCNGKGKAALLESKYIVMKFASGSIFFGDYVKTVGTNGVLSFGRPFTSFPTKLRLNYKYHSAIIDKFPNDKDDSEVQALKHLKGQPDSCHVYIALTDWDTPREIRTRPSERQLFDWDDPHIIAYAELIKGEDVTEYQQVDLELNYHYTDRTPKYLAIVATSSKYGDYFIGGVGSKLWLDNLELIYE